MDEKELNAKLYLMEIKMQAMATRIDELKNKVAILEDYTTRLDTATSESLKTIGVIINSKIKEE